MSGGFSSESIDMSSTDFHLASPVDTLVTGLLLGDSPKPINDSTSRASMANTGDGLIDSANEQQNSAAASATIDVLVPPSSSQQNTTMDSTIPPSYTDGSPPHTTNAPNITPPEKDMNEFIDSLLSMSPQQVPVKSKQDQQDNSAEQSADSSQFVRRSTRERRSTSRFSDIAQQTSNNRSESSQSVDRPGPSTAKASSPNPKLKKETMIKEMSRFAADEVVFKQPVERTNKRSASGIISAAKRTKQQPSNTGAKRVIASMCRRTVHQGETDAQKQTRIHAEVSTFTLI